jgi:ribosome-binding protein aMBF1 (putative translation factor)
MKKTTKKFYALDEVEKKVFKQSLPEFEEYYKRRSIELKNEIQNEIGSIIKKARKKAGLSQDELAQKIKTSKSNISRMEHGKQNVTIAQLMRTANALNKKLVVEIQ